MISPTTVGADPASQYRGALTGQPEGAASLRQRRAFYMQGLAESLRLPGSPLAALEEGESEATDGVLLRLLALRKGRALLARILSLLAPPPQV